jgi:two-component system, cell cycle response regulator
MQPFLLPDRAAKPVSTEPIAAPRSNVVSIMSSASRPARVRAPEPYSPGVNGDWVLVVDDDPATRLLMAQKLCQFSINIDYAISGEQAIALAAVKPYACIFVDVTLPGMDGYQVCRLIKSNRPTTCVVLLTPRDGAFDDIRARRAGCDAHLTRPIDEERLMNTIVRLLPVVSTTP